MTIHAFIEHLRYRWKAMSRHGIHSPFVYAFIEDVLHNRKNIIVSDPIEFPGLALHYTILVNRIIQHYNYKNIQWLPAEQTHNAADNDILVLPGKEPLLWVPLANKYFPLLKNDTVVFVTNIHETHLHTHEWNRLLNHPAVLMSIDVYGAGLLFFKEDFKEKQHFILKYKG